jgi:hypothetical protein
MLTTESEWPWSNLTLFMHRVFAYNLVSSTSPQVSSFLTHSEEQERVSFRKYVLITQIMRVGDVVTGIRTRYGSPQNPGSYIVLGTCVKWRWSCVPW